MHDVSATKLGVGQLLWATTPSFLLLLLFLKDALDMPVVL